MHITENIDRENLNQVASYVATYNNIKIVIFSTNYLIANATGESLRKGESNEYIHYANYSKYITKYFIFSTM